MNEILLKKECDQIDHNRYKKIHNKQVSKIKNKISEYKSRTLEQIPDIWRLYQILCYIFNTCKVTKMFEKKKHELMTSMNDRIGDKNCS